MESKRHVIPELEVILKQSQARTWTPEIDAIILEYYAGFSEARKVAKLRDWINAKYEKDFSSPTIMKHYEVLKRRQECEK